MLLTVEEFADRTPSVPAERIDCVACGATFIGDPADGDACPSCRVSEAATEDD